MVRSLDSAGAAPVDASGARVVVAVAAAGTLLTLAVFTTVIATAELSLAELGGGVAGQTWVIGGMSIGLAASLLTVGSLADRVGRRRVFIVSAWASAVAAALAALAPSIEVLVAARVVQGITGAGLLAAGLGMIGVAVAPERRPQATALWGAALGTGIAVGPLVAAGSAFVGGWRAGFWLCAVGAVAVALAALRLPVTPGSPRRRRADPPGALSITAAMTLLVAGVIESRGGVSATTVALLGGGVLALGLFVVIERLRREPMIDLALFGRPLFRASIIGALVTGLAVIAVMSFSPALLERGYGVGPFGAAVALCAWSVPSAVVATQVHRLPASWDALRRLRIGLGICALGCLSLALTATGVGWWIIVPGLLVTGVGSGFVNAALARLAVESVPVADAALGGGANNTARYLGSAVGTAVVIAVATGAEGGIVAGWERAVLLAAVLNVVALCVL